MHDDVTPHFPQVRAFGRKEIGKKEREEIE